jgi:hypothetical protein
VDVDGAVHVHQRGAQSPAAQTGSFRRDVIERTANGWQSVYGNRTRSSKGSQIWKTGSLNPA